MILIFVLMLLTLFFAIPHKYIYAHNEIQIGNYTISAGWDTEPPLLNFLNKMVVEITKSDDIPVRNALLNTVIDVKFGGLTKELSFNPSEESPSIYIAPIIPKSLGSYSIEINGMIENQKIAAEIQLEDVEDPIQISFPNIDNRNPSIEVNEKTAQIGNEVKSIVTKLSSDIEEIKNDVNNTRKITQGTIEATTKLLSEIDKAYLLGFIALSLGIVSIILTIPKMRKVDK